LDRKVGRHHKNKNNRGRNAMLVQIDQNSATVTPFGSIGSVGYSANANGVGQSVGLRPNAIRVAWRWICHFFARVALPPIADIE
jgi:hypothetical protein